MARWQSASSVAVSGRVLRLVGFREHRVCRLFHGSLGTAGWIAGCGSSARTGLSCHSRRGWSRRGFGAASRWSVPSVGSAGSSRCAGGRRQACFACDPRLRSAGRVSLRARPHAQAPATQWRRGSSLGSWGRGRRRCWRWACQRGVGMMVPAMLPGAADLHDSRGRPVSEMDGAPDIVEQTAMQKQVSARCGEHWTFSLCADTQSDV